MLDLLVSLWPLLLASLVMYLIIGGIPFAPWVPTMSTDLVRINQLAGLKKGDVFYELGCGDGRVCFRLSEINPDVLFVGIEYSLVMYIIAKIRSQFLALPNVRIVYANALSYDLSKASVVYVFGMAETMSGKVGKKLSHYMRPGVKIISYVFSIPGLGKYEKKSKPSNEVKSIYVYSF